MLSAGGGWKGAALTMGGAVQCARLELGDRQCCLSYRNTSQVPALLMYVSFFRNEF